MKKNKGQWVGLVALVLVVVLTLLRGQLGINIPILDGNVIEDTERSASNVESDYDYKEIIANAEPDPAQQLIPMDSIVDVDGTSETGPPGSAADAGDTSETGLPGSATDAGDAAEAESLGSAADTGDATEVKSPGSAADTGGATGADQPDDALAGVVAEDGTYSTKDEVAAYIHKFGHLPSNYINKSDAQALGWDSGKGNLWSVAPGMSIGGDKFGNREGNLPTAKGRKYTECDIDYNGGKRNAKRIVFSNDGLVFYTEDHYQTFEQLY